MASALEGLKSTESGQIPEKSAVKMIGEDAARHKRFLIGVVAVLFFVLAIFFYSDLKALFVIIALIALGAVSRLWQRILPLSIGADLIMLSAVISGVLYGSAAGFIVGLLSLFISAILTQEDLAGMWPSFFAISFVGYLAGFAPVSDISLWGVLLAVLYDAIISVAYMLLGAGGIRTALFVATHVAFNYFVFYDIAPALVNLLA